MPRLRLRVRQPEITVVGLLPTTPIARVVVGVPLMKDGLVFRDQPAVSGRSFPIAAITGAVLLSLILSNRLPDFFHTPPHYLDTIFISLATHPATSV